MRSLQGLQGRHAARCCPGTVLATAVVAVSTLWSATGALTTTWSMPQRIAVSINLRCCSAAPFQQMPFSGWDLRAANDMELQELSAFCAISLPILAPVGVKAGSYWLAEAKLIPAQQ